MEGDWTGPELCPMAGFGIISVEPLVSNMRELVTQSVWLIIQNNFYEDLSQQIKFNIHTEIKLLLCFMMKHNNLSNEINWVCV
jgi:hypothetical protein